MEELILLSAYIRGYAFTARSFCVLLGQLTDSTVEASSLSMPLSRLVKKGWLEVESASMQNRPVLVNYYRLTETGQKEAQLAIERYKRVAGAMFHEKHQEESDAVGKT